MRLLLLTFLSVFALPLLANEDPDPIVNPASETFAESEANSASDSSASSTSESSSESSSGADASADNSLSVNQEINQARERRVRVHLGGVSSFSSDALRDCHEKKGTKNGGLFAWGGRVSINDLCMRATLLIQAGYPEEAAKLILGPDWEPAAIDPVYLDDQCDEKLARAEAACGK